MVNANKKQQQQQVFDLLPLTAQVMTNTVFCSSDDGSDSNIYNYSITGAQFWKRDTNWWWQIQLATPNIAWLTVLAMKYTKFGWYRGNILGATTNTVTVPAIKWKPRVWKKIRIVSGTGAWQERTVSSVSPETIWDHGIVTAATVSQLTDTTKRWKINEHIGRSVRLVYWTGASQVRKVLYNDATNLYFADTNYQQIDPRNNTWFSAIAPYVAPVATAWSQTHYFIETETLTLDSAWTTVPDASSSFVMLTGAIWMLSSAAAAPFSTWQYYDCLSDAWYTKTPLSWHLLAALWTDISIERTWEVWGAFVSWTVSSWSNMTLVDSSASWTTDERVNYQIRAVNNTTWEEQRRRIVANNWTTLWIEKKWDTNPAVSWTYSIYWDTNKIYLSGNGQSTTYQYSIEEDLWTTWSTFDSWTARNVSIAYKWQEAYCLTWITRATWGVTAVNSTPVAWGTNYSVWDILTLSTVGTLATVRVESISAWWVVTWVSLYRAWSWYSTWTSATTWGTWTWCTISVTTVGVVGRVVPSINVNLAQWDSITISGASDAAYNTTYNILAIDSLVWFDIIITAAANLVASQSQSTTLLVDADKSWATNEHAWKLVLIYTAWVTPTLQIARISSNTWNALTLTSAITAAWNGTSRYIIQDVKILWRDRQIKISDRTNDWWATGGSTTTLVDSSKNRIPNMWNGYRLRIISGTWYNNSQWDIPITWNTNNTLTITTPGFTPDTTTKYIIMDTFGNTVTGTTTTLQDTTKNWVVNQWAGKRVRITAATWVSQELSITSNTANTLTFAVATAPAAWSTYTILALATRWAWCSCNWIFWNTTWKKWKYIAMFRGGNTNNLDLYDITKEEPEITTNTTPQTDLITTWCYAAYNWKDWLYLYTPVTINGLVYARLNRMNVNTMVIDALWSVDQYGWAVTIWNRMEVIDDVDWNEYVYIWLPTSNFLLRTGIYF